jgi:methionyl aminopeptidase
MAIETYGPQHGAALRAAGRVAAQTLRATARSLKAGMSTADIDQIVRRDTARRGGKPSQLGYRDFPAAVCTSPNQIVCHGIPSPHVRLADGDIINVDVTTELNGFHGDTSATFAIGEVSAEARHVVDVSRRCLAAGIAVVRDGARIGDIGAAICEVAHAEGCSVVRELGGHGIGRQMHQEPHIPHFGSAGSGTRLRRGMTFTIEPMINLGSPDVIFRPDGWTVETQDGALCAQFEHTVWVTDDGCEVLTALD